MILDFTDNYWGTTDTAQIDEWIHDNNDERTTIADVVYLPIRAIPVAVESRSLGSLKHLFDSGSGKQQR